MSLRVSNIDQTRSGFLSIVSFHHASNWTQLHNSMNIKLYIDGIPRRMGIRDLQHMFGRFGKVLSVQLFNSDSADSSGIGTVEMFTVRQAAKAVRVLHRSYHEGTLLLVFPDPIKMYRSRNRSIRLRTRVQPRLAFLKSKKKNSPPQA
jgi:hypothetical protein